MSLKVSIESSWREVLSQEFEKPYFLDLVHTLKALKKERKTIYPTGPQIFNAFNTTPFDQVKVVIIGQDPYHGPGQAMGLCFSVAKDVRVPASLKNIYKELADDIGFDIPNHGDLTAWAAQGVFMLNAVLTVEHQKAGSHKSLGWQQFTDAAITALSEQKKGLVFLLWGNYARSKKDLIDVTNHHVLEAAHPSPLARGAYFGSRHFSKTNNILLEQGVTPINWQIH
jgi:uracil-DNA glycosylase